MNPFEQIVAGLFRAQGYWTINGYRVDITKEEKREAGKHSMPRPELDILAYKAQTNELIWIECKSYLDSSGVRSSSFLNPNDPGYNRYKVFNDDTYRNVISTALKHQTVEKGLTLANPDLKHCLVAGNTHSVAENAKIKEFFEQKGWLFYDEAWLRESLDKYAKTAYEDDIVMYVSKILLRNTEK